MWFVVAASPEPPIGEMGPLVFVLCWRYGLVGFSASGPAFGPPGYVDSFWLTALPPLSRAEALRLLVGVPLPDRENSVKSWRDGSLYIATAGTRE